MSIPYELFRLSEIAFPCIKFPPLKLIINVNMQNRLANTGLFNPCWSTYIGPPAIFPLRRLTLYLIATRPSEYFVAIPRKPVNQHHNTAPGPPRSTAVATPTMFPVPIAPASEVVSAANWLTSPSDSLSFVIESFMALNRYFCGKCNLNVRYK